MGNRNGIFIFTKNREALLRKGSKIFASLGHQVFVIDDTTDDLMRTNIAAYCINNDIIYHGRAEQKKLIDILQKKGIDTHWYLKILGDGQWNLGYARNHALLLAATNRIDNLLFVDDDVTIKNLALVNDLFSALNNCDVIGSKITGMPDDSILGHIATNVGVEHTRLYSGGCLAFKASLIDQHFLNVYNEDWIWQFMQFKNRDHAPLGEAYQELFDPFENWQRKALFQEVGETLVDGLENAVTAGDLFLTTQPYYWDGQIEERRLYLNGLLERCHYQGKNTALSIIKSVLLHYPAISSLEASKLFIKYFESKETFKNAYASSLT